MNEISEKFSQIEEYLERLLKLLSTSKPIQKYIYYLEAEDPLLEPDVPIDLIDEGYILPILYDEEVFDDERVHIFLNVYRGNLENFPLGDILFSLDILIPKKKWRIAKIGKIRAFRIAHEFSKMVDNQDVSGIGSVKIMSFGTSMTSNKQYFCLSLGIRVKAFTSNC